MNQRGTKLRLLSQALQEISGIPTVFLRKQTRRGGTNLLVVGHLSGVPISRRIPDADPCRPEAAISKALKLLKKIHSEAINGGTSDISDRSLRATYQCARADVLVMEKSELIRSSTAQSRLRWLRRLVCFLNEHEWACDNRSLHQWIMQTKRGSRERRERITASRTMARAAGLDFQLLPEARFSSRHSSLVPIQTINEQATISALKILSECDSCAAWALSFCYATGIRLRGVLAINPNDLKADLAIGSVIRYWDGKVGRQRQSEAIVSATIDWLSLGLMPNDIWLAPWYRAANAEEHNRLELDASRLLNRVASILKDQSKWVAARYLRRLATRRLLVAGVHPLQVCTAIGTSLPLLEKRYSDLFSSEAALAVRARLL